MKRLLLSAALLLAMGRLGSTADGTTLLIALPAAGQRVQQLDAVTVVVRSAQVVATRSVTLSVNGVQMTNVVTPAPWRELRLQWDVGERAPGDCSIRVTGLGTTGKRYDSNSVRVVVTEAPWYPAPRARSYALLIGVGQYQDTAISTLTFSCDDAKALYRVLTDPTRGAYPPDHVVLMTDDCPADRVPTRANILAMLRNWLCSAGKGADSVMLYFSGHGVEENGKGYLVPRDARAGVLSDTAVDVARVNELLAETGAQAKLVILDACHSAAGKSVRVRMAQELAQEIFAEEKGRVTLASCGENQQAWEWPEKGQSVFTYFLVQALAGAADANRDGSIALDEVSRFVTERVRDWGQKNGKPQEPRLKGDASLPVVLAGFTSPQDRVRRPGWQTPGMASTGNPPVAAPTPPTPTVVPAQPTVPAPPGTGGAVGRTWTNPKDGMEFVFVPAGEFTMGSNENEVSRPVHRVDLPGYWIGKCEVTEGQFRRFAREMGYRPAGYADVLEMDDRLPAVNVTWDDAMAYCRWAGVRLPTEAEWEKAARGTDGRLYPWGNVPDSARCNTAERLAGHALDGNGWKAWWDGGGNSTQPADAVTPVGSYPAGASPYGCMDMAGNLYEWCSSVYKPYPHQVGDGREDPNDTGDRVARGGSWASTTYGARSACRAWGFRAIRDTTHGFRCAASPSE